MVIEWDSELEIGDPVVDQQHRALFELFNELETTQDAPAEIMRALDYLCAYVAMHFGTEEDLMAREDYPEDLRAEHLAEHEEFTQKTRDMILRFRAGEITSTGQVADLLRNWLDTHMRQCDLILVEYVRARGGAARAPKEQPPTSPANVAR